MGFLLFDTHRIMDDGGKVMSKTFVLMTALPPTKGHLSLIKFAAGLDQRTIVLLNTMPSEPLRYERFFALFDAIKRAGLKNVELRNPHMPLIVDPAAEGFWEQWDRIMTQHGAEPGDVYVSSEPYGQTLADRLQGTFIPYDPNRELIYTKATDVRQHTLANFGMMIPEFQERMRTIVTVFGAESTGKTTISKEMAYFLPGHWVFEYARPYLETVGPEITVTKMENIARGQAAVQRLALTWEDKPFIVQDTDLYSTIGYWEQPQWREALGPVPEQLILDAKALQSDIYIIPRSNIPFEADPLRYGGDHRESPDDFWIGIAEKYGLKFRVLDKIDANERLQEAMGHARMNARPRTQMLEYDRGGF
jgi:NadR type nicotinamide-nucleotide adenylyltransferase